MNRLTRTLLASLVATAVVLAPTAAGAGDANVAVAVNRTDGQAVAEASVEYRKVSSGKVDQENRSYAYAQCVDCQTLAAAFQLVVVTKHPTTLVPVNEALAINNECDGCVTWAAAKQVVVETGGPAELTSSGRAQLQAVENRLLALEDDLPTMTLLDLQAAVDAAFTDFLTVAQTEVKRTDGGRDDARVVSTLSA